MRENQGRKGQEQMWAPGEVISIKKRRLPQLEGQPSSSTSSGMWGWGVLVLCSSTLLHSLALCLSVLSKLCHLRAELVVVPGTH